MDLDDVMLQKDGSYSFVQSYKNSKVANVAFALSLAKKLVDTGVTVNSVHPGICYYP